MLRKGLLIWIWAIALLLSCWESRAESALYYVTGEKVNLRAGPGISYKVIGQRNKGDIVTVVGMHNNEWARIRLGSTDFAFIHRDYIAYKGPSPGDANDVQKRSGSSTKGSILDTIFLIAKIIALVFLGLAVLLSLVDFDAASYLYFPFFIYIAGYIIGWILGNAHLLAVIGLALAVAFLLFGFISEYVSDGPSGYLSSIAESIGFFVWKVLSWPFFALNFVQLFLSKPWRIAMRENWAREEDKEFYRKLLRAFQVPLYFVAAPVRVLNAVYYNLIIHLLYDLSNYLLEVFAPTDKELGRGNFWTWILWFPVRVAFFVGFHFTLSVIESIIWTVIDTFVPALTLFHGTAEEYAAEMICEPQRTRGSRARKRRKTGTWHVGAGNYAGDGIYFGISRKTLQNYQQGACIVARVSLGRTIDITLMPNAVYNTAGSQNAHEVSKWGLTHGYTTGEWWRDYPGWWEFCLFDRQNRYNDSWRIRPIYVLNYDNGIMQRIPRGTAHWLFRKMVLHDIGVSLKLTKE